jgi:DNA polymerase phi
MAKTLSFYWNLSSPAKQERIDASVKLIEALQDFQESHVRSLTDANTVENGVLSLESLNAADVVYALRRLIRGLASPRESSRQGFAVVLTEVRTALKLEKDQ